MFGQYALPSDDVAQLAVAVEASAEDLGYRASNLIGPSNTGHYTRPARPSKLTTYEGWWELVLPDPMAVVAAILVNHNLDPDLDVTIEGGSGSPLSFSQAIDIPARPSTSDDWTINPIARFDSPQAHNIWRLSINAPNSQFPQIGRILLLSTLRELETDVRFGEEEQEDRWQIVQRTEADVELLTDMFNVRRRFSGEFGFREAETNALQALWRDARNRILPWVLIPDVDVNDVWYVRFEDLAFSRVRDTIGQGGADKFFNTHPFRVKEVSRGLPWP